MGAETQPPARLSGCPLPSDTLSLTRRISVHKRLNKWFTMRDTALPVHDLCAGHTPAVASPDDRLGPDPGFREALTQLDLGEADVIVAPPGDHVEWARQVGYKVTAGEIDGATVYEIKPSKDGDTLPT
ncbi:hypothetical protein GCM10023170_010300 [Phytohabitans houttuyneae]